MNANDKFQYFSADTANPIGKYTQPKDNTNERNKPMADPNTLSAKEQTHKTGISRVSVGDPASKVVKTDGITTRGGKAQTKGKLSRGPMA
jgi:hypothetical protein